MNKLSAIVSENLRELRRVNRLTQAQMAEKIGVAIRSFQNYEGGLRLPKPDVISRICKEFQVTQTWLFTKGAKQDEKVSEGEFTAEDLIVFGEKLSKLTPKSRELILKQIEQILLAEEINRKRASKQA